MVCKGDVGQEQEYKAEGVVGRGRGIELGYDVEIRIADENEVGKRRLVKCTNKVTTDYLVR